MPINVCKSKDFLSSNVDLQVWNVAKAMDYAMKNNANIIALSLSLGQAEFKSNVLDKMIEIAYNTYNCIIFCSAGNVSGSGGGNPLLMNYPASNVYVYSVGALKNNPIENSDKIGDYLKGYTLDFVAYGYNITTTDYNNGYTNDFGATSSASPQLSGVAALILSYLPCISNNLIYEAIKNTARNHVNNIGVVDDYIYDNNTNSNEFGYGIPNVIVALDLLDEYEIESYTYSNTTTINSTKYAKENIIIENGGILTITGELQMSEDKKIVVQPGGKLIVDGGKITSGCGWQGIEVNGLPNNTQNTSTFGLVELKNNAILEHAMCGIKSIYGGIVQTRLESIFRNNYQSIVFEKYKENHQHTIIENTKFLCDGPVLRLLKGATGRVQASKEFIRIEETSKIIIEDCEFINEFKGKGIYSKVIGVNMYNAKAITIQEGCLFNGLSIGINAASLNGLLNFANIKGNTFTNVDESIKIYNSRAHIHNNDFELTSNAEISGNNFIPSVGVYTLGSVVKITDNSFSTDFNDDGYGMVIRNTKTLFESKIEGNTFSNLRFGNQLEQANKRLRLYCNSYTNISQNDWSVNPIYVGGNLLPMQGADDPSLTGSLRRAGNLFYDRDLDGLPTKHIRSSIEFVYNAAVFPSQALPEYTSSIVTITPHNENNDLSCLLEELPCVLMPCNPDEWTDLLVNTGNEDSILFYKQELLYSIALQDDISESIDILTELIDSVDYLELLIGLYINRNDYENASFVLQNHPQITGRDEDYYNFYTSLLDREFNEISVDSIPSSDITLYADIMSHGNDVSDLVKAYLNFNFDSTFVITPEIWEEESSRPILNPENIIKERRHNQKINLSTTVFPNPSNSDIYISYNSNEYNKLNFNITNILGKKIVDNIEINNNNRTKLSIESIPAGVYYVNFLLGEDRISTNKIIIIH